MSFDDEMEEAKQDIESGGWFKAKEGDNKMRILAEPVRVTERFGFGICYEGVVYCQKEELEKDKDKDGKPARLTTKFMTWIYDYSDKMLKLYKIPYGVSKVLQQYKNDHAGDYDFIDWPMPYDITINAKGAGDVKVEYTLKPARANTDVPEEVLEKLKDESTIEQVKNAMQDKQKNKMDLYAESAEGKYPLPEDEGISTNPEDQKF